MSHVNGNDIDDLFRRAADKYPLRTDGADWNRMVADLEKDPSLVLSPASEEGGGRRKRRLLWLLILLLPLGGAGYYFTHMTGQRSAGSPASVVAGTPGKTSHSGVTSDSKETPASGASRTTPASSVTPASGLTPAAGVTPASGRTPVSEATPGVTPTSRVTSTTGATPTTGVTPTSGPARGLTQAPASRKTYSANGTLVSNDSRVPTATSTPAGTSTHSRAFDAIVSRPRVRNPGKGLSAPEERTSNDRNDHNDHKDKDDLFSQEEVALNPFSISAHRAEMRGNIDLRVDVPSFPAPAAAQEKKTTHTAAAPKKPSFYVGLIAAPDFSTVKFQSVRNVGTTYGLLLGYSFNSRWAVETGVYVDRKKYYTDGEYFSRKNLPWGGNVNLLNADGVCNMWEIPVNVRYNLSQGSRSKWFATTGLSTYLMSKEKYSYQAENPTTGYKWPGTLSYNKGYQYWFSIVNFSVGYEQRLGSIGNLRLEPYLRVPLGKIGTGSLPIVSAGLNIGITRQIW